MSRSAGRCQAEPPSSAWRRLVVVIQTAASIPVWAVSNERSRSSAVWSTRRRVAERPFLNQPHRREPNHEAPSSQPPE